MSEEKEYTTPNGLEYESEIAGSAGARYYIIAKKETTKKQIEDAKKYIRENFDAVTISVEKNLGKRNK